ncbi:MAG: hypothetical protein HY069_04455 [Chlamydiia bacterium]|nr:hypothetical protein [Chlamydiia bacterium]
MQKEHLTTEFIRKKFKNNFDLCNLAINVGRNIVLGGHPATLEEIIDAVLDRADESKDHEP